MAFKRCIALSCVLFAMFFSKAEAGCKISRATMDGIQHVIIENDYVSMTFIPSRGGVCTSFIHKPTRSQWTTPKPGGAMFQDHIWQQSYQQSDWAEAAYVLNVITDTPEKVSISLRGQGTTGDLIFDTFAKVITIVKDSPAVHILYTYEVGHDAMSTKTRGLWFHHSIAIPGQKVTYFHPLAGGVKPFHYDPSMPSEEYWEYEPVRGWIGAIAESGAGIAVKMEYKRLMCFYQWFGTNFSTFEWMFRNEPIGHGSEIKTEIVLIPFEGLNTVDGMGTGGIISLSAPDKVSAGQQVPLKAEVFIASPVKDARLTWSYQRLPGLLLKKIHTETVTTTGPEAIRTSAAFTPETDGTYVLHLALLQGDEIIAEAEKSFTAGVSAEKYALIPREQRRGNPADRFGKTEYTAKDVEMPWRKDVVTPHVKWAKTYYKGTLKALFLMHNINAREIIELAQRMDIDFDAPLIEYSSGPFYVGDAYGKQNTAIMNDIIKNYLSKDGYDVIVVSGVRFKQMDAEIINLLRKQTEKGVGLVFVAPNNPNFAKPEDASFLPVRIDRTAPRGYSGKWSSVKEHPILQGVPVNVLPATGFLIYKPADVRETADIILQAKTAEHTYPLAVVSDSGKQRTVVFNYRASRIFAGWGDTLTPFIRFPEEQFHYWEYHLSLLYRAMLWTAHKEPDVFINQTVMPRDAEYGGQPPVIKMEISGAGASGIGASELEVILRDKEWNVVKEQTLKINPAAGSIAGSVTAPSKLPTGYYFADCILKSQGKTVAWATGTFNIASATKIKSFAVTETDRFFKTGDTVIAVADIVNAVEGMRIEAVFSDHYGRHLGSKSVPVPAGGKSPITVTFPVEKPLGNEGFIHIVLKTGDDTVDSAITGFLTAPDEYVSRTWDDYEIIPWGALGGYHQGYLIPALARQIRQAGVSVLYPNAHHSGEEDLKNEHESSYRAGFKLIQTNALPYNHNYPKGWEDDRRNYQRTGDKIYLHRKPSLSDPEYLKEISGLVKKQVDTLKKYCPLAWMWGDELSLIGRMPVFDYDFSAPALKEFRAWLSGEYGSLDSLNREWRTEYTTWDKVVPLTTAEAREQQNFASWSDHRTFMDRSYARFFQLLIDTVQETAPGSRTGLSGTQAPTAYNGHDWTLFSRIFTYMQPYYYQGKGNMLPAFNPGMPKAQWSSGYGITGHRAETRLWSAFLAGDTGTSFFSLAGFHNPDYTFSRAGAITGKTTKPFRTGLGKLWSAVRPEYDPIAVLYSQRSLQGAYIVNREWWRNHEGWFESLHDLGYRPRFVPYQQLCDGLITTDKYKVLILPFSISISRQEAEQIEKFVRSGGTVIADIMAGAMNGHCSISVPGMLDGIFGISRAEFNQAGPQGNIEYRKLPSLPDFSDLPFATALHESLQKGKGNVLGNINGTPCLIFNSTGKGNSVYLNIDMARYLGVRNTEAGGFYREVVGRVMLWNGLSPDYTLADTSYQTQIFRQREGNNLYAGYIRPEQKDITWKFRFAGKPMHVYNSLSGKYHGLTSTVASEPSEYAADLFALLPYRVTGLSVKAPSAAVRGERVIVSISVNTASGKPSYHAARINVTSPAGEIHPVYSANIAMPAGKGKFELPFALNDPQGKWKIEIVDAATKTSTEATLILK